MNLFKIEARFKTKHRGRYGVELVVHARTKAAAEAHVRRRYTGCTIERTITLPNVTKHFVVADLVDE